MRAGRGEAHLDPATAGSGEAIRQAGELRSARIESLRALAALGVMLGHVFGSAYGYRSSAIYSTFLERAVLGGGFGVEVFFALSGYLLFWPFAKRTFGGGTTVDLRRYAINRALRILPLYYAVMVILLIVQNGGGTFHLWWTHALFAESYSASTLYPVDAVMWSLVVEIHFYLLLPVLAYVVARLAGPSLRRGALILGSLGAASLVLRYFTLWHSPGSGSLLRYQLPSVFFYFVFGMLLALLRISWERRRPTWVRGLLAHSDVWLLAAVPVWAIVFYKYQWEEALVGVAAFLMIGACVLPLRKGVLLRVLEWRVLAFIGVASYSLYLWHNVIIGHVVTAGWVSGFPALLAVTAPLSLVAAIASYAVIETPFLRLRKRWASASAPTEERGGVAASVAAGG